MSGREICFFAMILPVFLNFHREEESYTRIYDYEQFQFEKKEDIRRACKICVPCRKYVFAPSRLKHRPEIFHKTFLPSRRDEREEEDVRGFGFPSTLAFSRGGALALEGAPRQRTHQISSAPLPHSTPHRNPESARPLLARFDQWRISAAEASSPPRLERR
jgi:hypothetical protein